jgi:hypothetical protein
MKFKEMSYANKDMQIFRKFARALPQPINSIQPETDVDKQKQTFREL